MRLMFYFFRTFTFNTILSGEFPLWNPYIFSGTPFVAGFQAGSLYPLNLILILFPVNLSIIITIIIHLYGLSAFTYIYSKFLGMSRLVSFFSSSIFLLSSTVVGFVHGGHLAQICTISWIPLIFYLFHKGISEKKLYLAYLGGGILTFQFLAGYPQYFVYTALIVGIFTLLVSFLYKNLKFGFNFYLFSYLISFFLSQVQLLPALEFIKNSSRGSNLPYQFCSTYSLPLENLITFLLPSFFGDGISLPYWGEYNYWGSITFIGIIPLIFAIFYIYNIKNDKRIIIFFSIIIITLILALGNSIPFIFKFLYNYIPTFNLFRGPQKFILFTLFFLSIMAGLGVNQFLNTSENKKIINLKFFIFSWGKIVFVLLVILITIVFNWESFVKTHYKINEITLYNYSNDLKFISESLKVIKLIFLSTTGFLLALITVIFLKYFNKISSNLFILLILFLSLFEVFSFEKRYMTAFDVSKYCHFSKKLESFLKKDKELYRVVNLFKLSNQGMIYKIGDIGGWEANLIKRYNEFINATQGLSLDFPQQGFTLKKIDENLDMLNIRYLIAPSNVSYNLENYLLVFQTKNIKIYENQRYISKAWTVHRLEVIEKKEEIFKRLFSKDFDIRKSAIIETPFENKIEDKLLEEDDEVIITSYKVNSIELTVNMKSSGFLVLSEVFFNGWKVYINGKEDVIYPTNYILRGIFLDKGEHQVKFLYRPLPFFIGLFITLFSFPIWLIVIIRNFCN